jgi:hypothetical protein
VPPDRLRKLLADLLRERESVDDDRLHGRGG